jgi:NADH:ubiquinone reductase (H+-translocating)
VELAGAFAEIKNNVLPKDYPGIDFSQLTIYLIEGSKSTLSSMSNTARTASGRYLTEMGVVIKTETFVTGYDEKSVLLSDGESIPSSTVIWAAGVTGNKVEGLPEDCWVANNRIVVNRHNRVQGI